LLSSIRSPALTPSVLTSLASIKVRTVEDFLFHDNLANRSGLSLEIIDAIQCDIQRNFSATLMRGDDLFLRIIRNDSILPTGCKSIDDLLDGGLYTSEITELVGQPSTGKTQLCMYTCINLIARTKWTVAYIDSSNTFSPNRMGEMLNFMHLMESQEVQVAALNRVECMKCFDVFSLLDALHALYEGVKNNERNFHNQLKLVVIDSLGALISPVLGGKQSQGHALMISTMRLLKDMATRFHIAILITNYVVGAERGRHKAALGETWPYGPNTSLMLELQSTGASHRAVLIKSSRLPSHISSEFEIVERGLVNENMHR